MDIVNRFVDTLHLPPKTSNTERLHAVTRAVFDALVEDDPTFYGVGNYTLRTNLLFNIYSTVLWMNFGAPYTATAEGDAELLTHMNFAYTHVSEKFPARAQASSDAGMIPFIRFVHEWYTFDINIRTIARFSRGTLGSRRNIDAEIDEALLRQKTLSVSEILSHLNEALTADIDTLMKLERATSGTVLSSLTPLLEGANIALTEFTRAENIGWEARPIRHEHTAEDFARGRNHSHNRHEHEPDPQQQQIDLLRAAMQSLLQGMDGKDYRRHLETVEECLSKADRISRSVTPGNYGRPANADDRSFDTRKPIY